MTRYRPVLTAISLALVLGLFVTALVRDLSGPAGPERSPAAPRPVSAPATETAQPAPSPLARVFAPRSMPGVAYATLDIPVARAAAGRDAPAAAPTYRKPSASSPGNG